MFFETSAAVQQLTKRYCPWNVAFLQKCCPRTLGTPVTLHKPQRANQRHHGAFLNLSQHEPIFAFRLACCAGSLRAFLIALSGNSRSLAGYSEPMRWQAVVVPSSGTSPAISKVRTGDSSFTECASRADFRDSGASIAPRSQHHGTKVPHEHSGRLVTLIAEVEKLTFSRRVSSGSNKSNGCPTWAPAKILLALPA